MLPPFLETNRLSQFLDNSKGSKNISINAFMNVSIQSSLVKFSSSWQLGILTGHFFDWNSSGFII